MTREPTYQLLGHRHPYAGYKAFVEQGVDDDLWAVYGKDYLPSVLGDHAFKETLAKKQEQLHVSGNLAKALSTRPAVKDILQVVATRFQVPVSSLTRRIPGRPASNVPRKFAMYCCHQLGDMRLKDIARTFGLTHEGSVSPSVQAMKVGLEAGELQVEFAAVRDDLGIMK